MQLETYRWDPERGWSHALLGCMDGERTFVAAFGPSSLLDDPAPLEQLRAAFPTACVVGCSTSGEILGSGLADGTLTVAAARFERAALRRAAVPIASAEESFGAGWNLARALDDPDLRAVFVLSDGLDINGTQLVAGLLSVLGDGVVVTGGLAGDGDRFRRTWVLVDGRPMTGHVSAVGFYGAGVRVGHGSVGGWSDFGPERIVTRARANVLYELDGQPALPIYKEYLGDLAEGLPATALLFPLALRDPTGGEKEVVRTILGVDEEAGSLTFAGDVPLGSRARLMVANLDRLITGAGEAAARSGALQRPGGPVLAMAISCVGRRLVLDDRVREELDSAVAALPPGAQQVGFYSYGELSPGDGGFCELHNQTMTMTTIGEE